MSIPPPRREYIYTDPSTGSPVFEYSGGAYIMAGCDIESYTVDFVCVTEAEQRKHSGIKCNTLDTCPCLRASQITYPPATPFMSGGKISQSQVEERADSVVKENSVYVFDHMRVRVQAQSDVRDACLPDGHKDGVFYFPIKDMTPVNLLGCQANILTGQVTCVSGVGKELGFADAYINGVDMPPAAYLGETFIAKPIITKQGNETICLTASLYKGNPSDGILMKHFPVRHTINKYDHYLNRIFPYGGIPIPADSLEQALGTAATGRITKVTVEDVESKDIDLTSGFTWTILPLASSREGAMSITFVDKDNDRKITCTQGGKDTYQVGGKSANVLSPQTGCKISNGQQELIFTILEPKDVKEFKDIKELVIKVQFVVSASGAGTNNKEEMNFVVELGQPRTADGDCSAPVKLTNSQAGEYKVPFTLFREKNLDGLNACGYASLEKSKLTKQCVCGTQKCGTEDTGFYCYADTGTTTPKCQTNPLGTGEEPETKCGDGDKGVCKLESECDLSTNNKLEGCSSPKICCYPK